MRARRAPGQYSAWLTIDRNGFVLDEDGDGGDCAPDEPSTLARPSIEAVLGPEGCQRARHYLRCPEHPYDAVFETDYRRRDGTSGRGTVVVRPVPGKDGVFLLTIDDERTEQEIGYLSQLTEATVERLTDMIIWLDEDARYVFVNPAATRLLGYSAEELREMHVWDVDPFFDQQKWRDHWREIAEKGSFTLETVNRSKMGVDIPIEVTVNLVEFSGRRYNCSIVRDISARKAAESELRSLNARVLRLSITDEMTGLGNRRHFDAMLARQFASDTESDVSLSLILLDIDSFKAFNDCYGHLGGDDALRKVAALLSDAMVRPDWLACRYGGEEFACILPETSCDDAVALAEALRSSIEALGIVHDRSLAGRVVTASFGVMTMKSPTEETIRALLAAADAALYRAKRAGGNCVAIGRGAASADSGSAVAKRVPVGVRRDPC